MLWARERQQTSLIIVHCEDIKNTFESAIIDCILSSTIDSFYQYHPELDGNAASAEELPPPAYSDEWGHIQQDHGGIGTNAQVAGQ
jgi:hypothetical protein